LRSRRLKFEKNCKNIPGFPEPFGRKCRLRRRDYLSRLDEAYIINVLPRGAGRHGWRLI
jgi:hypothetical protein